jgi:hypothetical protein
MTVKEAQRAILLLICLTDFAKCQTFSDMIEIKLQPYV